MSGRKGAGALCRTCQTINARLRGLYMNGQPGFLTFAWWNLHDFAHHNAVRSSDPRWPKRHEDYEAKRNRILAAFQEVFGKEYPDLIAVCEITREAAQDLAARLPGGFGVTVSPPYPHDDGFQVAVFYRAGVGFSAELPLIPTDQEDVAEGTRPMVPVHFTFPGHAIRFVACHWTAFDTDTSRLARERLVDVLRRDTHAFLEPEVPKPGLTRHVVVLGDLNEEPMATVFEHRLIGRRDRESSHSRHWRDASVRRIRLYNAAWRYLGEQVAHGTPGPRTIGAAGTYFKEPHNWRTFDHVLVSCGLLGASLPYLDEAQTRVVSTPIMRDEDGRPRPFEPGRTHGVSDTSPS
jgi:endonuclease/exonuclease/phosphatase family metal-dependent hydrolase